MSEALETPLNAPPTSVAQYPSAGMSLRDYFAAKAMPALLQLCLNDARGEGVSYLDHVAAVTYGAADAMLAEREKRNG